MKQKKININKNNVIKVFTILIFIISISIYEFGICNGHELKNFIKNGIFAYNLSVPRIVLYTIFFILLLKNINNFLEEAVKTLKLKTKKIVIGIYIPLAIIVIIYVLIRWISIYKALTVIIALLMGGVFIFYVSSNYIKNIILTTFTLGVVFTFSTDFHHEIDEKKHMMSAVNLANGNFNYAENPLNEPEYNNIYFNCDIDSFVQFYSQRYEPNLTDEWDRNEENEIYYICSSPAGYNFILYIPSATGIIFAKTLGGSIADVYIIGRLFNLIAYGFILTLILKLLPYKKKIFYIIYMLPFTLLISASYSIDGMCIGILGLFIAYCFNLAEKDYKEIKLKQIFTIMGLFLLCMLAKNFAYCTIILLVFVLPIFKILKNNKKNLPLLIIIILIAVVICGILLVSKFGNTASSGADPRGGTTSVTEQINFLLSSPTNIFKVGFEHIANSLLNYNWYTYLNHRTFFGPYFSQVFLLELIFVIYICITDSSSNKVNKRVSIVSSLTFFAVFITTSFMLYLTFTPVGNINIAGYQPRYITPVMPIILMLFNVKRFISKISKEEQRNVDVNVSLISGLLIIIDLICLTQVN